VFSYTRPRENIVRYPSWYLQCGDGSWQQRKLVEARQHGKGVVALLADCHDRDQAQALNGCEIGITRDALPAAQPGEYYWHDLQGLSVVTVAGEQLGSVDHLIETGANDVLVVKGERERLIPFVMDRVIVQVDLEQGEIRVDWDKDF